MQDKTAARRPGPNESPYRVQTTIDNDPLGPGWPIPDEAKQVLVGHLFANFRFDYWTLHKEPVMAPAIELRGVAHDVRGHANIASRSGQCSDLLRLADQIETLAGEGL